MVCQTSSVSSALYVLTLPLVLLSSAVPSSAAILNLVEVTARTTVSEQTFGETVGSNELFVSDGSNDGSTIDIFERGYQSTLATTVIPASGTLKFDHSIGFDETSGSRAAATQMVTTSVRLRFSYSGPDVFFDVGWYKARAIANVTDEGWSLGSIQFVLSSDILNGEGDVMTAGGAAARITNETQTYATINEPFVKTERSIVTVDNTRDFFPDAIGLAPTVVCDAAAAFVCDGPDAFGIESYLYAPSYWLRDGYGLSVGFSASSTGNLDWLGSFAGIVESSFRSVDAGNSVYLGLTVPESVFVDTSAFPNFSLAWNSGPDGSNPMPVPVPGSIILLGSALAALQIARKIRPDVRNTMLDGTVS